MTEPHREYLTQQKYDELTKEVKELKNVKRKEVAEALDYARSLGDLSENAEYHEARAEQAEVEERIAKLEMILKNATIVEDRHGDHAIIGSTVTVEKKKDGTRRTFMIVGSAESDMASGKISNRSPLGAAVLGKKKGEVFSFTSPSGPMEYSVVEVK
ncbi:MAG: transcription elongation factor GreA [Patescibacteria group bacterium]|nr:transcription elongation factor GreA [Patescibacteria group bacterium]MDE1946018.1 transcription elongation factor GreA [Patescibacteria group bacterium]